LWLQKYNTSYLLSMNLKFTKPSLIASISLFSIRLFIFSISLFLSNNNTTWLIFWEIFSINSTVISFPIILDPIGTLFSAAVLFISANVIIFTSTYIKYEIFLKRFVILVLLFVVSINILIFFPHLITLLLGWDGLGLSRFILVIYYQNAKSLGAGIITALTNRIGDVLLLLAIGWTFNNNHWSIINIWHSPLSLLIILCILFARITKRAQIPFSSWLPAAIAAPTPVSALVHSSTLVTAGVFLTIRFYEFLSRLNHFSTILLLTASLTMFIAGISAITECDLKKIIALSTLRQLGVIIARLALGYPKLAFFHLITHAIFKALLFICAGSIIHYHSHGQDLRTVGNLTSQIPLTIRYLLIANISLCAAPFLSGFYSKDLILELSLFRPINFIIIILFFTATIFTASYSIRLLLSSIWSNNAFSPLHHISNHDFNIVVPGLLLTLGAIIAGSLINWTFIPFRIEPFLPFYFKFLPISVTILGGLIAWQLITEYSSIKTPWFNILQSHYRSSTIWFLAPISTQNIIAQPLSLASYFYKIIDNGWTEIQSAEGIFYSLSSTSNSLISLQNNPVNSYLIFILLTIPIFYLFTFICFSNLIFKI